MDTYEKIGYACLAVVAACYLGVMVLVGVQVGGFGGLVGLLALLGIGVLLIKVIKERRANAEDDYYERNVHK